MASDAGKGPLDQDWPSGGQGPEDEAGGSANPRPSRELGALSRRSLLSGAGMALGALSVPTFLTPRRAGAAPRLGAPLLAAPPVAERTAGAEGWRAFVAQTPAGFTPLSLPGVVTCAEAKGDFAGMMQPNQLWPREAVARSLLERALTDLTGAPNLTAALGRFVSKQDTVAIKVNGIAGQVGYTMAVNFELVLPLVEALLECEIPPNNICVYEQYPTYLMGTRVNVRNWQLPSGVKTGTHNNRDHAMPRVVVFEKVPTRYCRFFTDATAVIDMTMMKDHSLCGFTGAMKNITHGNIDNPHHHHAHQASPQIAMLYNHPIVRSRVRLHISDAFKIIYDRGPLDKDPRMRVPHGAVYASTDPVALDVIGWKVIDDERRARGGMTLKAAGREPRYIHRAAELGLGIGDLNDIRLHKSVI